MRIIEPSYEILTPINGDAVLKAIEKVARTCYKSEDKIGEGTAEKMILNLIKNCSFCSPGYEKGNDSSA